MSESTDQDYIYGRNIVLAFLMRTANSEGKEDKSLINTGLSQINKIFLAEDIRPDGRIEKIKQLARLQAVPVYVVERRKLDRLLKQAALSEQKHQGVVAQVSQREIILWKDFLNKCSAQIIRKNGSLQNTLLVLLDGIEDPHNLGAIIRSAESAGAQALLLPARRSAAVTGVVAKTSAGALAYLPIVRIQNIVQALEDLKKLGFWIIGMDSEAKEAYYEVDLARPSVFLIGSEGEGLGRLVAKNCDLLVRIPMLGQTESLNASVAAGIVLFEFVRQNINDTEK